MKHLHQIFLFLLAVLFLSAVITAMLGKHSYARPLTYTLLGVFIVHKLFIAPRPAPPAAEAQADAD